MRALTICSVTNRLSRRKWASKSPLILPNSLPNNAFVSAKTNVDLPEPANADDIINILDAVISSIRLLRNAAPIYHENRSLSVSSKNTSKKRLTKRVSISK